MTCLAVLGAVNHEPLLCKEGLGEVDRDLPHPHPPLTKGRELNEVTMISTADKFTTLRMAKAVARINASPMTVSLCKNGKSPKGNAIEMARAAGVLAAKKTSELIPFCHPIPLDHIGIDINCKKNAIEILAEATAVSKTGVEMEALTAASVAALTIYDMLKPIDKNISISRIKLIEKRGGKSDFLKTAKYLKAAVVVTSDSRSRRKNKDTTGPAIKNWLKDAGFKSNTVIITPDRKKDINDALRKCCKTGCDLIITTGGTGIGPRDVTVEATRSVIEREVPGISEAIRSYGQKRTPFSMLSRGIAGIKGKTLIVNLPGSPRGVKESLNAITPGILHAFEMIKGKGH